MTCWQGDAIDVAGALITLWLILAYMAESWPFNGPLEDDEDEEDDE